MDPACCRAPCAYWSPGSEGPGDEPKSQAWLGVHHCIWLPKGQNSLEAPSPIWPTSDGLKLSFDLKLLVIWSLLKKKKKRLRKRHDISLETCFLSYFHCVPPTTGTGARETGNLYVIFASATAFLGTLRKAPQKQDHQLEFSWLEGLRSGRRRLWVSLR